MCAIAGIVSKSLGAPALSSFMSPDKLVESMLSVISHRGREGSRTAGHSCMWIGCCRLPIVDRDQGEQPFKNETGEIIAVFNGEIYNHIQLKEELQANGRHIIKTDCDTEVIPHLYEENRDQPERLHDYLQGMYSIAIIDKKHNKCVVLRDHIGKKPLYVFQSDEFVAFASEIKAFTFTNLKHRPGTILEIGPGETWVIEPTGIEKKGSPSDWRRIKEDSGLDSPTAAKLVRETLKKAVSRRIPRDLPVAVLCSGGIDSVCVAYLAKEYSDRVTAYVIGMENAPDVRAATSACAALRIPLKQYIVCQEQLSDVVSDVVYHTESFEPNIVRNSLLSYLLFQRIKHDGFRVALCGEGADELFHGYSDFEAAPEPDELMRQLLDELHRTQLLRVDRTSMAFNVEVRVPFLDRDMIQLACRIPYARKHARLYGGWQGKAVLREAFRDILPLEILSRDKATFSYGAGFGNVTMNEHGPMEEYAKKVVSTSREKLMKDYPYINQTTHERALYLCYYQSFFPVPASYVPPKLALKEHEVRHSII